MSDVVHDSIRNCCIDVDKISSRSDKWSPLVHTRTFPTDSYGTFLFEGDHHPNKAHYVRLSYDTYPELVVHLLRYVWGVPMPKLVVSVHGGSMNFAQTVFDFEEENVDLLRHIIMPDKDRKPAKGASVFSNAETAYRVGITQEKLASIQQLKANFQEFYTEMEISESESLS